MSLYLNALPSAKDIALALSGLFWTLAYLAMIRAGWRVRSYAMPLVAICLNLTWEVLYTILGFANWPNAQAPINLVWLVLDVLILVTFFRAPTNPHLAHFRGGRGRLVGTLALMAAAASVQLVFLWEFGLRSGAVYSAFLQNLVMSGLFLAYCVVSCRFMQTAGMAAARALGTLFATLAFGVFREYPFALVIGAMCLIVDVMYIYLNRGNWGFEAG